MKHIAIVQNVAAPRMQLFVQESISGFTALNAWRFSKSYNIKKRIIGRIKHPII